MIVRALIKAQPPKAAAQATAKLYIERIDISEINTNISLTYEPTESPEGLIKPACQLDNCALKFNQVSLIHEYGGIDHVIYSLVAKYTPQALSQIYLIILSTEVFGFSIPKTFFKLIFEGLWDFIYLPYVEIFRIFTSPMLFCNAIMQVHHF